MITSFLLKILKFIFLTSQLFSLAANASEFYEIYVNGKIYKTEYRDRESLNERSKMLVNNGDYYISYTENDNYISYEENEENYKNAANAYRFAASYVPKSARANFRLAFCYHNGIGVNKNLREAMDFYLRAADLGNAIAEIMIGFCRQDMRGEKDPREEMKLVQGDMVRKLIPLSGKCDGNGLATIPYASGAALQRYYLAANQENAIDQFKQEFAELKKEAKFFTQQMIGVMESIKNSHSMQFHLAYQHREKITEGIEFGKEIYYTLLKEWKAKQETKKKDKEKIKLLIKDINAAIESIGKECSIQLYLEKGKLEEIEERINQYKQALQEEVKLSKFYVYEREFNEAIKNKHMKNANFLSRSAWVWQFAKLQASKLAYDKAKIPPLDQEVIRTINQKTPWQIWKFKFPSMSPVLLTATSTIIGVSYYIKAWNYLPSLDQTLDVGEKAWIIITQAVERQ